jgi:hypothetical protein
MEESWMAARSPLTKPSPGKTVAAVAALAEEAVVLTVAVAAATKLWPSVIAKQRGPEEPFVSTENPVRLGRLFRLALFFGTLNQNCEAILSVRNVKIERCRLLCW